MIHWVCVTNPENWEIIKTENVWGMKSNSNALEGMNPDELILIYISKISCLGGLFKITSKESPKKIK